LKLFNDNKIRYLVIGGYAFIQYAEPRFTKDLDLWISTDVENAVAIYNSLRDFGAPLTNLTEHDFMEEGYLYQTGVPPVRIGILMGIPGINFDEAWVRRMEVNFEDLLVSFIFKEDLITSKRASSRPQDHIDADTLSQSDY